MNQETVRFSGDYLMLTLLHSVYFSILILDWVIERAFCLQKSCCSCLVLSCASFLFCRFCLGDLVQPLVISANKFSYTNTESMM